MLRRSCSSYSSLTVSSSSASHAAARSNPATSFSSHVLPMMLSKFSSSSAPHKSGSIYTSISFVSSSAAVLSCSTRFSHTMATVSPKEEENFDATSAARRVVSKETPPAAASAEGKETVETIETSQKMEGGKKTATTTTTTTTGRVLQVKDEDIRLVSPAPPPSLFRRFIRFFLLFGAVTGVAFALFFDLNNDRVLTRSARCAVSAATILAMYRFTWPETPEQISDMNTRAARTLLDLCVLNEGLYIKLGQQVHSLNQILPPEYGKELRCLLDSAPAVPVATVRRTIEEDLGKSVEELFVEWEEKPIASASIAQVHRAKLRTPDGKIHDVAVKVQKPNIRRQMWWDLQCYFAFCFCLNRGFGLPVWWSAQHIAEKLTMEIDFTKEAQHIQYARQLLLGEQNCGGDNIHNIRPPKHGDGGNKEQQQQQQPPRKYLKAEDCGDVYVPRVFEEALSPRVLVTEWIESLKLHQTEKCAEHFDMPAVLNTVVRSFADLVFHHGFVHADPHPANVLLRPHPKYVKDYNAREDDNSSSSRDEKNSSSSIERKKKYPQYQVVYIDWGLATKESDTFRRDYARLFTAVFMREETTITDIISSWGISDPQLFASLIMQKPVSLQRAEKPVHQNVVTKAQVLDMQRQMKEKAASLLEDESKTPKELILLGRGMNLIRSVNKSFGAPVNRVNILAEGAARALGEMDGGKMMLGGRMAMVRFKLSLAWLSFVFHALQWYAATMNWLSIVFTGRAANLPERNIETVVDEVERSIIESQMPKFHGEPQVNAAD